VNRIPSFADLKIAKAEKQEPASAKGEASGAKIKGLLENVSAFVCHLRETLNAR
jgi:hypothetical protein